MKKMMLIAVGALALGSLAQTAIPQPVTLEKNKIPAVPSSTPATVQEYAPGALCRVYRIGRDCVGLKSVFEALNAGEVALDQGYDATAMDFDGEKINKHGGNLFVWEGVFKAKRAGKYVILLSDGGNFVHLNIGGQECRGESTGKTNAYEVNLAKGANKIKIVISTVQRGWNRTSTPVFEYRLFSSVKLPKKITPALLSHVVEDEEEW